MSRIARKCGLIPFRGTGVLNSTGPSGTTEAVTQQLQFTWQGWGFGVDHTPILPFRPYNLSPLSIYNHIPPDIQAWHSSGHTFISNADSIEIVLINILIRSF